MAAPPNSPRGDKKGFLSMNQTAAQFLASIQGKKVAFLGVGVSNNDCIRLFRQHGVDVTVCDRKTREQLGALADEFERLGCTLRLGEGYLDGLDADIAVRAPGIYFLSPEITALRDRGMVVTSEMELFFDFCPCPIYAVTGSDGKTTTTSVIAALLAAAGRRVHLGGNIGRALLPLIGDIQPTDAAVVELSSFQLLSMRRSPEVAVITNVSPNHLNVHRDYAEYIDSKRNLYRHQNAFSRTVLNAENEITASMCGEVRGRLLPFSSQRPLERGVYLQDGVIWAADGGKPEKVMAASDILLLGTHNAENYMAAIAATFGEVPFDTVREVARTFTGVEHRMEFVRTVDGVRWYNDSIATSPTRTIAGLRSFDRKVILIAGGSDKNIPYEPLAPAVLAHVKRLILMGKTAPKIEAAVTSCNGFDPAALPIVRVSILDEAVAAARDAAQEGDVVFFSPVSASFDLYPNFEARGAHFKRLVAAL